MILIKKTLWVFFAIISIALGILVCIFGISSNPQHIKWALIIVIPFGMLLIILGETGGVWCDKPKEIQCKICGYKLENMQDSNKEKYPFIKEPDKCDYACFCCHEIYTKEDIE